MADEYRFRFKRNCHVAPGITRQKCYTLKHHRSKGRLVTYVNLLNHFKTIKELYDSFEEEDLHCAIWRLDGRRRTKQHLAISWMLAVKRGAIELLIQRRKKAKLKRAQKALFFSPAPSAIATGEAEGAGQDIDKKSKMW